MRELSCGSCAPRSFLAAGLALALSACAAGGVEPVVERPGKLPSTARVADVPFHPQAEYYCGPASLQMLLGWSGEDVTQDDLAGQVYTPGKEGTLRSDLVAGVRRHGRLAVQIGSPAGGGADAALRRLLAELAAGHPVLVFQNLSLGIAPQWHFAVAIGYDLPARELVLHSGRTEAKRVGLDAFARTWARGDRWALLALPPDRLPATAEQPTRMVEAAAGLERAGRNAEAATAYATILDRWPDSFAARMGRGNALYATQRYAEAAAAFRRATDLRPEAAEAWNNLAYAEHARGRADAALTAARRAVKVAEPKAKGRYRDTLREIRGGPDA